MGARTFSDLITFTRASTGTYTGSNGLLQTAAVDQPRFDYDPATGEKLGLLVEEQRTNLLRYSEQFDNAAWGKAGSSGGLAPTVSTYTGVLPNGETGSVIRVSFPSITIANSYSIVYQNTGAAQASGVPYTPSIFIKRVSGGTKLPVSAESSTSAPPSGGHQTAIYDLTDDWRRYSTADTLSGTPAGNLSFVIGPDGRIPTHVGLDAVVVDIWGAQLEAGAFPTSYIPTTSSQVTRSADVASITGTNFSDWYRQEEGTFVAAFKVNVVASVFSGVMSANNGSASYVIDMRVQSSALYGRVSDSSNVFFSNAGSVTAGQLVTSGICYKTNDFAVARNGSTPSTDTSGTVPSQPNRLLIGGLDANILPLNGHMKSIKYYPKRLSNAELQAMTA